MIGSKIQKTLLGKYLPVFFRCSYGMSHIIWLIYNTDDLVLQEQPLDDQEMEEDLIYVSQKLNEIEQTLSR